MKKLYIVKASSSLNKIKYFKIKARTIKGAIRKASRANKIVYSNFEATCVEKYTASEL